MRLGILARNVEPYYPSRLRYTNLFSISICNDISRLVMYLFRNDQVDVDISVNEIEVRATSHCPPDSHQAMLFCVLKNGVRF